MNYDTTQRLLDAISPYCDLDSISVSTENKVWKGSPYYFVYPSGEEDCISGMILHKLIFGFKPFARKHINSSTWQYDVKKGCFTTSQSLRSQRRCYNDYT